MKRRSKWTIKICTVTIYKSYQNLKIIYNKLCFATKVFDVKYAQEVDK